MQSSVTTHQVYITSGSHVNSKCADTWMSAYNNEDADSRICLPVGAPLNGGGGGGGGATILLVRTVDTDVVVSIFGSHCWVHECVSGWIY